jgi:hypothetical protein
MAKDKNNSLQTEIKIQDINKTALIRKFIEFEKYT